MVRMANKRENVNGTCIIVNQRITMNIESVKIDKHLRGMLLSQE